MGTMHVLELAPPPPSTGSARLQIYVIHTTFRGTQASLKAAGLLAKDLDARVELLVPQVVPYPLPLDRANVDSHFTEQCLRTLAAACPVELTVHVLLCRDRAQTIPRWLPPASIAVLGRRRRWGPESSRALIRAIRRGGHHLVVVDAVRPEPALVPLYVRQKSR